MPEQIQVVSETLNAISGAIVDAALHVHKQLGPGLLESVYETCLAHELRKRGLTVSTQVYVPIHYDGIQIDAGLRLDMLVEEQVVVEIKAVEQLLNVHQAQLVTYLKLSGLRLGLLINFNVTTLKSGLKRIVL